MAPESESTLNIKMCSQLVITSEPYTKILLDNSADDGSLYIDIRSVLNLTCAVYSPEIPAAIFWKHNGKVRYDTAASIEVLFIWTKMCLKHFLLIIDTQIE